jgi:hypothetical protein
VERSSFPGKRNPFDLTGYDSQSIVKGWLKAVEEFSKLTITYESDQLPAMMGIATIFQRCLNTGYIGGIWESDVVTGLLWRPHNYSRPRSLQNYQRQCPPLAPSWKASLDLIGKKTW